MRCWFYLTESRDRVAVPEADFFLLAEAGVIRPQSMVWTEGMEEWMAAGELHPELFGDPTSTAPVDLPTVLQMVRSLSAPLGRSAGMLKAKAVLTILTSLAWVALTIFATVLGVRQFGGGGWLILFALPLSGLPLLTAMPLLRVSKLISRAHGQLDRGAFYGASHSLGRYFWLGFALSVVGFVAALSAVILAIIYRGEIFEFIKVGVGVS